jgi:serine-type D-Ala-D-Ala carboxypeptidase/endopeptidase (penicillin-binding protein 4)
VPTGARGWSSASAVPMRGASTTKLITAVTSLHWLGTTTRFPTRVVAGRNAHEVVLVGGGDPLLTSAQLSLLARTTAKALVASLPAPPVTAPAVPAPWRVLVRVDDTLFPSPTSASGWTSTYVPSEVAPVRALVRDGRNSMDTSAEATTWFAARLQAEMRAQWVARADLAPVASYAGRLRAAASAKALAVFSGNTSGAALTRMLLISDNDIAETMFRHNALKARHSATWGAAQITAAWTLTGLRVDISGWVIRDGSGLSRTARLTARGLVQLLRVAQSPSHPELAPLVRMLPVGGVSGTLSASYHRFDTSPTICARGKVFAKTGSLHDVIALAGYARGSDGRLKAFAVLVDTTGIRYSGLTIRRSADRVAATATGCY